jgi:hypothetical protein
LIRFRNVAFALATLLAVLGARCEAPELLPPDRNRPPDTFLTAGPDSADVAYFQVRLYWRGFDEDGTVSEWQYAIDDTVVRPDAAIVGTGWIRTTKTDSMFIFSASTSGTDQQRDHRFFIASVDNEGKPDPTPAVLDFTARTFAYPVPEVTCGPAEGDTLPVFSSVTLCWGGSDADGEILKMAYRLDPIDLGFTTVPIDSLTEVTYENLPSNGSRESYRFLLVAEDDAGSRNIAPVERRFVVNHDPHTVITRFYSTQIAIPHYIDPSIVDGDTLADSSEVTFEWEAGDVDGEIKGAFWTIDGLLSGTIFSDPSLRDSADARAATFRPVISNVRGGGGGRLIVGSVDEYGRAEGSPDTIQFFVNFPPSVVVTEPAGGSVTVTNNQLRVKWQGSDRDGPTNAIAYDVELFLPQGSSITTRINAGLPPEKVFDISGSGLYRIEIKGTDRKGDGKTGEKTVKSVVVTTGGPQ